MLGHEAVASGREARGDLRTAGPVIITPTEPQPQYHATMAMPVHGMPKGWFARVLFLLRADGTVAPYAPLVDYMRDHPGHGGAWQDNVARGLGLLWDFTRSRGQENLSGAEEEGRDFLHLHFRAFALALLNGTIRDDGDDPSGLFWPRTGLGRTRILLGAIERFAAWQAAERKAAAGHIPDPDERENRLGFTEMLVWSRVAKVSMLRHISKPKAVRVPAAVDIGSFGGFETETVKFFPPEHAERLLYEGHVRPGREHEPDELLRFNLRDQMMALLDGWGGLRRSEGLHLWVQDVAVDRDSPGHAIVVLHHPAEAQVWGWDKSAGRMAWRSRQEVLDRDYHGLRPRHLHMRGGYHAGWKGMALNANLNEFVYWRDPVAGLLFWNMYVAYLCYVRPALMARRIAAGGRDHPFLFVSEGRGERSGDPMVGSPYSPAAYERNHEAAVRRMDLPYAKDAGTTTHGLRHLYGQTLAQRGLSAAMIRKCMRHLSFLSQVPYVAPTRSAMNATLNAAIEGRPGSRPLDLEPGGSESSQALYRLNEIIKGRMPA